MKIPAIAVLLVLAGAGSVKAQSLQAVPTIGGPGIGGSGSLNGSGAINRASSTPSPVGNSDPRVSKNVEATNPGEYVPSTYENYDAAVDMGRNAVVRPPTLVEAARMAQHAKEAGAAKPMILLEKNAEGNLIIVPARVSGDVQSSATPHAAASNAGPAAPPVHTN